MYKKRSNQWPVYPWRRVYNVYNASYVIVRFNIRPVEKHVAGMFMVTRKCRLRISSNFEVKMGIEKERFFLYLLKQRYMVG